MFNLLVAPVKVNPFKVEWFASRRNLPVGAIPLDGQLVQRSSVSQEVLSKVLAGTADMPTFTDSHWLSHAANRAAFSYGDGSTNIRMPDYNGKHQDSYPAAYLRGDGLNAPGTGNIQADSFKQHNHVIHTRDAKDDTVLIINDSSGDSILSSDNASDHNSVIQTSRYATGVNGGNETRPVSIGGCYVLIWQ